MAGSATTIGRPEARAESVGDLVAQVLEGRVRIPVFQRDLSWGVREVVDLFDSIYRGFPIGSLLLQQAPAEAAEVSVGPMTVMATERQDALWVVDGQQRLTSLAAALGRPGALPAVPLPDDPFVIYFDPGAEAFRSPSRTEPAASTWVPLPELLDASRLQEWVFAWPHRDDASLRARVFEAQKRIREYPVPLYVMRTTDEGLLRTVFTRVNTSGKPLTWSDLHDGLFGHKGKEPSSLSELAAELSALGMGRPADDDLLSCLIAYQGLDVTRSFREHLQRDPKVLDGVAAAALPTLRRVLGFLRVQCEIAHLRLLPYSALLVVLTRCFRVHPEPNDRSQTLLARWVWRTLLAPDHDDRAFRRGGVQAVTNDEEATVQALLGLVPAQPKELSIPDAFDARSAQSRLILLVMASLGPSELESGDRVDIARLVRERDLDAFRALFPPAGRSTSSPTNRVFLPGEGSAAASLRAFVESHGPDHPSLRTHAIDVIVAEAIRDRDVDRALGRRGELLVAQANGLGKRLAGWGRTDRPSLDYLMKQAAP